MKAAPICRFGSEFICAEKHLHACVLTGYDFRYNQCVAVGIGDVDRTLAAITT
jgi:hypothetical protein